MLEARGLRVDTPRGTPALHDVGVIVHPREVVAVVGPHGSGKSILLRALAGLVPIRTGTVTLNGEQVTTLPAHDRAARGIAYAPEPARTAEDLSVRDILAAGAWLRKEREAVRQDLARVLDHFPILREKQHHRVASLSGDERRMVALGRALLSAPRVLLLDEPLPDLTSPARGGILGVIREARAMGVATLLAAHDLADARDSADRTYALRTGRVIFAGSMAALEMASAVRELYD
jgi:branched-chain amino acid transport system ATP-binding protein